METSGGNQVVAAAGTGGSRRYGVQFSASNFIQAPLSALLEYSGILRNARSSHQEAEPSIASAPSDGEVAIRIIGSGDHDSVRVLEQEANPSSPLSAEESRGLNDEDLVREREREGGNGEVNPLNSPNSANSVSGSGSNPEAEGNSGAGSGRDSSYQRYDIQQVARWIEQILPFSLLLLVVFIRQHLQGTFDWILVIRC